MIARAALLSVAALLSLAAAPPASFNTTPVLPPVIIVKPQTLATNDPSGFTPAPLPNRDATGPAAPRGSRDASLSPSIFTRRDQYRGEGLGATSSNQIEQERRVQPGAGINLSMPLQ